MNATTCYNMAELEHLSRGDLNLKDFWGNVQGYCTMLRKSMRFGIIKNS